MQDGHDTSQLEMVVLMTPDMANFSGKVHGGALLNLLDRVAYSCASRFSQEYAVTLSVDQVVFRLLRLEQALGRLELQKLVFQHSGPLAFLAICLLRHQ